jgi:hypothetical protein
VAVPALKPRKSAVPPAPVPKVAVRPAFVALSVPLIATSSPEPVVHEALEDIDSDDSNVSDFGAEDEPELSDSDDEDDVVVRSEAHKGS